MSDNQRRFFCRLLFLFFCFLPTAVIIYRACHPRTPEFWQRTIQSQLGIATEIADVETPVPGQTLLRGLTLLGADGVPILSAIETRFDEERNRITIQERVRLTSHGLNELATSLNERIVGSGGWSIHLADVEVINDFPINGFRGAGQGLFLAGVEIEIAPTLQDSRRLVADAFVSMKLTDGSTAFDLEPVVCHFRCHEDPTMTTVDIETGDAAVPCWLAQGWLPQLAELGPLATFQGRVGIDPVSRQNIGRVTGRFENVALPDVYDPPPQIFSAHLDDPRLLGVRPISSNLREYGALEIDMAFNDSSGRRLAQGQPLQITGTLELPDGSRHPIVPEYHLQQVLEIRSAIGTTVRAARSQSASSKF